MRTDVVTEGALFYAYRNDPAVLALQRKPHTERRPCACRGIVEADPENAADGVERHNATSTHRAWREARER